jgi:hypothetical protein
MPRGEEWYYIDTAEAIEIMAEYLARTMPPPKRKRRVEHGVRLGPAASEVRDEYAEAIAYWRHWAGDE